MMLSFPAGARVRQFLLSSQFGKRQSLFSLKILSAATNWNNGKKVRGNKITQG